MWAVKPTWLTIQIFILQLLILFKIGSGVKMTERKEVKARPPGLAFFWIDRQSNKGLSGDRFIVCPKSSVEWKRWSDSYPLQYFVMHLWILIKLHELKCWQWNGLSAQSLAWLCVWVARSQHTLMPGSWCCLGFWTWKISQLTSQFFFKPFVRFYFFLTRRFCVLPPPTLLASFTDKFRFWEWFWRWPCFYGSFSKHLRS